MSKKEKKRQKKAAKDGKEGETEEASKNEMEKKNIGDLLFKSPFEDVSLFSSQNFFSEPEIFKGMVESENLSEYQGLSPRKLFLEIKSLAERRYQYNLLPKKQAKLRCLSTPANKISLLRDIAKVVGFVVNAKSS